MKYNVVKIMLITNSLVIAAAFLYFALKYSNWDVTIISFCLFLFSIVVLIIYNMINTAHQKEMKQLKDLGQQLSAIKKEASKILEQKKNEVSVSEPHYTVDNKAENDQKRFSNSYPSLSHIGEDEYDELTECERSYRNYLKKITELD